MNKIILKSSVFAAAVIGLFAISNVALADTVTGTLSTGLNATLGATVNGVVIAPPVATPAAGSYNSAQSVTLTADGASSIHYGTDGSTLLGCSAGSTGTVYSSPIPVSSTMTIEAISCYSDGQFSTVASYTYTITPTSAFTTLTPVPLGSSGGGGSSGSISPVFVPVTTPAITTTTSHQGQVLGAAAYNFTKNLTVGSRGADVTALQQFLTDEGFYSGTISGYFGQLTKAAVIAFQKANNLPQTGYVGPLTLALLNKGVVPTTPETTSSSGSGGAGLTTAQVNAIISILQSFGVDQATIAKVEADLGNSN
ncbi:MAG: peptidoglycan-binding protein [Minisyncoccia bacterium]|jgi:peptidoglycan hydrolase-like protein with peptidoglycan-binding domain